MNDTHADYVRSPARSLVSGFWQPRGRDLQVPDKTVDQNVVAVLEERMWRDRRELFSRRVPVEPSGVGRLRARIRDFLVRMQLGPVADDQAGRDPETRF